MRARLDFVGNQTPPIAKMVRANRSWLCGALQAQIPRTKAPVEMILKVIFGV